MSNVGHSVGIQMNENHIISTVAIVAVMLTAGTSMAGQGDQCYSISNPDQKYYCLATAKSDKNQCYSISNSDQKYMCLAIAGGDKSRCYSIQNNDMKRQCLGQFG